MEDLHEKNREVNFPNVKLIMNLYELNTVGVNQFKPQDSILTSVKFRFYF